MCKICAYLVKNHIYFTFTFSHTKLPAQVNYFQIKQLLYLLQIYYWLMYCTIICGNQGQYLPASVYCIKQGQCTKYYLLDLLSQNNLNI